MKPLLCNALELSQLGGKEKNEAKCAHHGQRGEDRACFQRIGKEKEVDISQNYLVALQKGEEKHFFFATQK